MEQTLAQQWAQKKKTRPVTLPSGMTVQVKQSMLYSGMMANVLPTPILKRILEGSAKEATPDETIQLPAIMRQMVGLIMQVVVEPVIVDRVAQSPNEIALVDVPDEDILYLIGMIFRNEAAESLGRFRDGAAGAPSGPDVSAVQPTAVNSHAD